MRRSDFLKIIGAGSLVGLVGLPSVEAVDKFCKEKSGINPDEDPFLVIRQLMKEVAKPDWEYHFMIRYREMDTKEYSVLLYQNKNIHRESWFERHPYGQFNDRVQNDLFKRMMYSVEKFNALPQEKRDYIAQVMENIK
jgi:hypothetical protein